MLDFGFWIRDFRLNGRPARPASRQSFHAFANLKSEITNHRRGFTLTEILIVIALVVLMLALAVPAFNIIRGSRSTDSAQNQVSAMLGHARADAIGLQKIHGIMFFINDPKNDPSNGRVHVAEVTEADYPTPAANATREVYLDLVPDTDFLVLPQGVLAFTLANEVSAAGADRYIGYNTSTPVGVTSIQYGGVILFDGNGQLTTRTWGFRTEIGGLGGGPRNATPMQFLISGNYANRANPQKETGIGTGMQFVDAGQATSSYTAPMTPPTSSLGFVLCDESTFKGAGGSLNDPLFTGAAYSAAEANEESWLDDNSSQLIVNRYNGTLTQAQ